MKVMNVQALGSNGEVREEIDMRSMHIGTAEWCAAPYYAYWSRSMLCVYVRRSHMHAYISFPQTFAPSHIIGAGVH